MKKDFVRFYSPGTFSAETTTKPIDEWDVTLACSMALDIKERHGATPYGFRFITRERNENDLDSHISKTSGMYYLGGTVYTLKQLIDRNNPDDAILIENMSCNGWNKIIENRNSWKWVQPLEDDAIVLGWQP